MRRRELEFFLNLVRTRDDFSRECVRASPLLRRALLLCQPVRLIHYAGLVSLEELRFRNARESAPSVFL
jgi:hypothetical protein